MLSFSLQSPKEVARDLAHRVKRLRLERGWTQEETAERAAIKLATYRRFEATGLISLERLLRLAVVFDALSQFDALFRAPPPATLAELEGRRQRRRGRRRDAKT